jgi:hypothetical protein
MSLAIGLMVVNAETQHRVGRDAWLLTAWWIVVGVACSALLLEIVGVRSSATIGSTIAIAHPGAVSLRDLLP